MDTLWAILSIAGPLIVILWLAGFAVVLLRDDEHGWIASVSGGVATALVCLAGLWLVFAVATSGSDVQRYCQYGAVSQAQLEGCIDHVSSEDFADSMTEAARFARGELGECLEDSGPFCEEMYVDSECTRMFEPGC